MSEKRKDSKGRVLQAGEYQKADGRYEYRYEYLGRAFSIYSWRLVESDPVPPGKRNKPALRTMKKDLVKDLSEGIQSGDAKKLTLNECADKLFEIRRFELAPTTIYIYEYLYNTYVRNVIGKQTLQTFTQSKIKAFYARLSIEKKLSTSTIKMIHQVMKQSFEIAVEDDLLRKNPCNNALKLSKSCVSLEKLNERDYLSKEEEDRLVKFLLTESDSFTISVLTITILNTGLHIGEITVLQWDDCDFARNVISVNKTQIRYRSKETGKEAYMIKSPKSISGIRTVPMLPIVKQLLLELREEQRAKKLKSPTSMGYNNYVFFSKRGAVFHANMFYNALRRKIKQYNEYEEASAIQEQRAPCYMPFVSAHDLRRTFATRLNENNVNPKIMQTILGHSNVQTTWSKYIKTSEDLTEEQYLNVLASSSFISSMNTSLDASCDSTQPLASQNKQTNTLSGFGDLSNHQLISPNAKSNSGMDFTNNLPSSDGKL